MAKEYITQLQTLDIYLGLQTGNTAPLRELLKNLPDTKTAWMLHTPQEHGNLLKLMNTLMAVPEHRHYVRAIMDKLPSQHFVDSFCTQEPTLLETLIQLGSEAWVMEAYKRICWDVDVETYQDVIIGMALDLAHKAGKYRVIREIFTIAFEWDLSLSCTLLDGWHPLCFAAKIDDIPLARAYLKAMADTDQITFHHSSLWIPVQWRLRKDQVPLPENYSTTMLEEVALSHSPGVMRLILKAGAEVNSRAADGRTLLDIATDPKMKRVLREFGGRNATDQELLAYALSRNVLMVKADPKASFDEALLEQLLNQETPLFRMDISSQKDHPRDHQRLDLLRTFASAGQTQALCRLYQAVRPQLSPEDHYHFLAYLLNEGPFDGFYFLREKDPLLVLEILEKLYAADFRCSFAPGGRSMAQRLMEEILAHCCQNWTLTRLQILKFCRVISRICQKNPRRVYAAAHETVSRQHPGDEFLLHMQPDFLFPGE